MSAHHLLLLKSSITCSWLTIPEQVFNIIRDLDLAFVVVNGLDLAQVTQRLDHLLLCDLAGTILVVQDVATPQLLFPVKKLIYSLWPLPLSLSSNGRLDSVLKENMVGLRTTDIRCQKWGFYLISEVQSLPKKLFSFLSKFWELSDAKTFYKRKSIVIIIVDHKITTNILSRWC